MNKCKIKQGICCVWLLPLCWLAGLMLLWLAFALPDEPVFRNVVTSLPTLQTEGLHRNFGEEYGHYRQDTKLDGYTDLLYLNYAASPNISGRTSLERAVAPQSVVDSSQAPQGVFVQLISCFTETDGQWALNFYHRYWFGSILPLRVILSFLNYDQFRVVNQLCQILLFALSVALVLKNMGKQKGMLCALMLTVAYIALQPRAIGMSIQFSPCFYIAWIGCCLAACTSKAINSDALPVRLLFLLGAATSYFDLLTYPILTLGLPLLVLAARMDLNRPLFSFLMCMVLLCIAWFVGYAGMWAGKWLIAWLFGYHNVFAEAMGAFSSRIQRSGYSIIKTILGLKTYCYTKRKLCLLLLPTAVGMVRTLWQLYTGRVSWDAATRRAVVFGFIALFPVAWTCFALNHTSMHFFYTHRIFALFFAALGMGMWNRSENRKTSYE